MTTYNNATNSPWPLYSGASAGPTTHGVIIGQGSSAVNSVTLGAGQVLVGTTASDPVATTITGSGGVTVSSTTGAIAISGSGTGLTWVDQATTTVTMAVNTAYIISEASATTLTLPATAAEGSVFGVVGKGAGGWTVAQASGQSIHFGNVTTTSGTGGSLASSNQYDVVWIVCITANTLFSVYGSIGNLAYV